MRTVVEGVESLNICIDKLANGLNPEILNRERARVFIKYTRQKLQEGSLGLSPNTGATTKIQGSSHQPLSFTGGLAREMDFLVTKDKSVEAGWFAWNGARPKGSKLSYTQLALLHTTGFRVPLTGDKGARVRRYLASQGIYVRKTKTFLIVKPRPFFHNSLKRYTVANKDYKVVKKYVDALWRTL